MAFPARKPEAGKAKNSSPCSTSDSNKNQKQFFLQYSYLFIIMTIRNVFFTGSIPKVLQVNRKYRVLRNQCKKGKNIDHKATTSPLLSFHKVWRSSKTQILLVSTQIKNFFFNSSNIELCICRCMKQYKVNFQYLMTKRLCKTYMKIIPKYIQVPPILNFLYGSFSSAWVIYLTVSIISTFISISTFPKKDCYFM